MTVLDSSALLAFLLSEPGADRVQAAFPDAALPLVNMTETIAILHRKGVPLADAEANVSSFQFPILTPSEATAIQAARLSIHPGLSLGDCYCLAEAMAQNAPVLTGDRAWAGLNLPIQVKLIR